MFLNKNWSIFPPEWVMSMKFTQKEMIALSKLHMY